MKKRNSDPEATEQEREPAREPGSARDDASAAAESAPTPDSRDDEIAKLKDQVAQLKQRVLESAAELDNQAKRFARERPVVRDEIVVKTAREMLEVIDNLDRTLASVPPERAADPFIQGVAAIRAQFEDKLRGLGVERVIALNERFDPFQHEAISEVPRDDVAPGTIVDEVVSGWRMGSQLVRASKVRIARAP